MLPGAEPNSVPGARFAWTAAGLDDIGELVVVALRTLALALEGRAGPLPAGGPPAAARDIEELAGALLPENGQDPLVVMERLTRHAASWAVNLGHPAAVARMQPPALAAAAAAELVTAVLNQGLQAWESGPAAIGLERLLVRELCALVGYPEGAGGTLTSGGSVSNLVALVLAREHAVSARTGGRSMVDGTPGRLRPLVLCGPAAHYSVRRAAGIVGFGSRAVVEVASDSAGRIDPDALDRRLADLTDTDLPVAVVATAGTTDLGTFDRLDALADVTRRHHVWLHVDGAYGGAALFSERLSRLLVGADRADSFALDFHKLGWAPASASAFLVRDEDHLSSLAADAAYLATADDAAAGYTSSPPGSLQTTRRADAMKVAVALGVLGRQGLSAFVESCHDLAVHAADRIAAQPGLELAAVPVLSTVVFRCVPTGTGGMATDADALNATVRRLLAERGESLVGRTTLPGEAGQPNVHLKLVLMAPTTTPAQIDELIERVAATARAVEAMGVIPTRV